MPRAEDSRWACADATRSADRGSADAQRCVRRSLLHEEILRAIAETLEDTPPELAGDIAREGILLARGTLLRGLPELVTERTGMAVSLAESR